MIFHKYKIYEVGGESDPTGFGYSKPRTLIDYQTIISDSHELFKKHIRETHGSNIKFARSKKMVDGDLYCVVVMKTEDESRFRDALPTITKCANCGKEIIYEEFLKWENKFVNVKHYDIRDKNRYDYCGRKCQNNHLKILTQQLLDENDGINPHNFIDRSSYYNGPGYIYMITKKSTGEFYIGQTNTLPVFRWAQHLKSSRFPIDKIEDYKFEILIIVKNKELLYEIENKFIKDYATRFPTLILNGTGVTKKMKEQTNIFEED